MGQTAQCVRQFTQQPMLQTMQQFARQPVRPPNQRPGQPPDEAQIAHGVSLEMAAVATWMSQRVQLGQPG
eukprot:2208015-Lingulodinium_polyedra.AAC.1